MRLVVSGPGGVSAPKQVVVSVEEPPTPPPGGDKGTAALIGVALVGLAAILLGRRGRGKK